MQRIASAQWNGGLKDGKGSVSTSSGVLKQTPYSFSTRFENQPRINLALRKHIYHLRGVIAWSRVRSPFTPVDSDTLADLDDILARLQLLTTPTFAPGATAGGKV